MFYESRRAPQVNAFGNGTKVPLNERAGDTGNDSGAMITDSMTAVESTIRRSEVMAVVRALRSEHAPRLGDTLDYFIEVPVPGESSGPFVKARSKPYRFAVEQWHLDAARVLALADGLSGQA
jgi:hypothetical protein